MRSCSRMLARKPYNVGLDCHPERSEGPLPYRNSMKGIEVLRSAQDDSAIYERCGQTSTASA